MPSPNLLITSAGRRVSLVKMFKKELIALYPDAKVFVTELFPELSAAAQIAHEAFKVCEVNHPKYINTLLQLCIANEIKLIIPTIDTELRNLSENLSVFENHDIHVIISKPNWVETFMDKRLTYKFFKDKGINTPKIYDKRHFKFPIFIKPVRGSGSKNNYIVEQENQLSKYHLENNDLIFFEYLSHDEYYEYTCDLYYDNSGVLKCVVPRRRIEVRSGETSKGLTSNNELVHFILNKLRDIPGLRGCITAQFFLHKVTRNIKGIEINPRFGGGYPLSFLAGANFPKWIIEEYLLKKKINFFKDWKNNLLLLRYDDEILQENFNSDLH